MKIKYGIFALMLTLVTLLSGVYFYQTYHKQKILLIKGIDKKLYTAAMMARAILPQDYHDNIVDSTSIPKGQFDEIVTQYNQLCVDLNLKYLWSLMIVKGNIIFTTSTSPDKKTANQKHAKFFEVHTNPEFFRDVLSSQTPQYRDIVSKWGKTRMVLLPFQDSHERPYLFGASIKLSEVDALLTQNIKESLYFGSGFLLAGLILSYLLSKMLSSPLNKLASETSRIASGRLDKQVEEKGFYEQVVLARSFNQMILAINQKIAALAESEEKSRITLNSIGDGVIVTDINGNIVLMNPVAEKLTAWKSNEATGKHIETVFNIVHSKTGQKAENPVGKVIEKGEIVELGNHIMLIAKDGKEYQIADSAAPIQRSDSKLIGVVFVFHDVTKQYKMREEIIESEQKYRSMMEAMDDPAYICSKDFTLEYMNPAMIDRLGYNATGELCYKAMHALEKVCPWCVHETVMKGESIKTEVVSPKDNRIYYVSNSPIFHSNKDISKLTIFRDITENRKMELTIQQSQKMEAIGTLAAGIAHDFNNILFPIIGYTEMLQEDIPEDSPFKKSLDKIFTGALRAKDLVKQILAFSRQEESELKPVKIQTIIKEVMKLVRASIPTTISITQNLQSDCGAVNANPIQIHQIVLNLATNAYHAMEKTGGELKIILKKIELDQHNLIDPNINPGLYACLIVTDTGIGMEKRLTEKIFNPFFTTKEKGKGTGMGLSVVHGFVENMNGAIKVDSEPGMGSEFSIYLPIIKTVSENQRTSINESLQIGVERVLLVDDEESIITMEKAGLERLGYRVAAFTSSIEALEAFRATPDKFDIVITDLTMPNIPGDELSAELTKINLDIPILLCTGFSEAMTEEKAASLGIKRLLLKPILIKDLAKTIRDVLDESSTQ